MSITVGPSLATPDGGSGYDYVAASHNWVGLLYEKNTGSDTPPYFAAFGPSGGDAVVQTSEISLRSPSTVGTSYLANDYAIVAVVGDQFVCLTMDEDSARNYVNQLVLVSVDSLGAASIVQRIALAGASTGYDNYRIYPVSDTSVLVCHGQLSTVVPSDLMVLTVGVGSMSLSGVVASDYFGTSPLGCPLGDGSVLIQSNISPTNYFHITVSGSSVSYTLMASPSASLQTFGIASASPGTGLATVRDNSTFVRYSAEVSASGTTVVLTETQGNIDGLGYDWMRGTSYGLVPYAVFGGAAFSSFVDGVYYTDPAVLRVNTFPGIGTSGSDDYGIFAQLYDFYPVATSTEMFALGYDSGLSNYTLMRVFPVIAAAFPPPLRQRQRAAGNLGWPPLRQTQSAPSLTALARQNSNL